MFALPTLFIPGAQRQSSRNCCNHEGLALKDACHSLLTAAFLLRVAPVRSRPESSRVPTATPTQISTHPARSSFPPISRSRFPCASADTRCAMASGETHAWHSRENEAVRTRYFKYRSETEKANHSRSPGGPWVPPIGAGLFLAANLLTMKKCCRPLQVYAATQASDRVSGCCPKMSYRVVTSGWATSM